MTFIIVSMLKTSAGWDGLKMDFRQEHQVIHTDWKPSRFSLFRKGKALRGIRTIRTNRNNYYAIIMCLSSKRSGKISQNLHNSVKVVANSIAL